MPRYQYGPSLTEGTRDPEESHRLLKDERHHVDLLTALLCDACLKMEKNSVTMSDALNVGWNEHKVLDKIRRQEEQERLRKHIAEKEKLLAKHQLEALQLKTEIENLKNGNLT